MKTLATTPISILDLARYTEGRSIAESYRATRDLAQHAERWGYRRFWLAEHHSLEGVASAATAVLISYVADHTRRIRVGSGGIMLPNHAPLIVAEQFGTLATLYPGRIDLGLGRAPGSDQATMRAIRKENAHREFDFAEQLTELLHFFEPADPDQRVKAIPGAGLRVPIWILGSSLYSARLAARRGLPYAFAGHFAPQAVLQAFQLYRAEFVPSGFLRAPHTMLGVPVIAADTDEKAGFLVTSLYQSFLSLIRGRLRPMAPPVASMQGLWSASEETAVRSMLSLLVLGGSEKVRADLDRLIDLTQVDELIITSDVYEHAERLRSFEIVAGLSEAAEKPDPTLFF